MDVDSLLLSNLRCKERHVSSRLKSVCIAAQLSKHFNPPKLNK